MYWFVLTGHHDRLRNTRRRVSYSIISTRSSSHIRCGVVRTCFFGNNIIDHLGTRDIILTVVKTVLDNENLAQPRVGNRVCVIHHRSARYRILHTGGYRRSQRRHIFGIRVRPHGLAAEHLNSIRQRHILHRVLIGKVTRRVSVNLSAHILSQWYTRIHHLYGGSALFFTGGIEHRLGGLIHALLRTLGCLVVYHVRLGKRHRIMAHHRSSIHACGLVFGIIELAGRPHVLHLVLGNTLLVAYFWEIQRVSGSHVGNIVNRDHLTVDNLWRIWFVLTLFGGLLARPQRASNCSQRGTSPTAGSRSAGSPAAGER